MSATPNPTINVKYDPSHNVWMYSGPINSLNQLLLPQGSNTITFNLIGPEDAVFTATPLSWRDGQQPPISNLTGEGTNSIRFTEDNINILTAPFAYRFGLAICLANGDCVTSPDPTLINEGTGG